MTKRTHLIHSTGSAIAAALALASTPVLGQEIVLPPVTATSPQTPAPPAPQTQTSPAPTPPPAMISEPVVQDTSPTVVVPDTPDAAPEEAASEPRAEAAPAEPVQVREAAPAPSEASPIAAPDAPLGETTSEDLAPIVPPVDDTVPLPSGSALQGETAETANQGAFGLLEALLAAIAVVALAVWGFVAIGRRKQTRVAVPVVERPAVADRPSEPQTAVVPPLATREASVTPLASPRPATGATADSLAHSGASVALPSKMPEAFEERDALLRRMIAAKPDRANPFTSPLQRRRRAKLILQSLDRDFGDVEPWIDLSQYPSNWPSVARRTSAAA